MDTIETIRALSEGEGDTKGHLQIGAERIPCAFGRSGLVTTKREGDGGTPIGEWPLRKIYYRADRIDVPSSGLDRTQIVQDDIWCDDPASPQYNTVGKLPFDPSHENLWREDHLYDLMIPMGYNDSPIVAGNGSAIFFHLAKPDYQPTEGCVAIAREHMLELLPRLGLQTVMQIGFSAQLD